MQLPGIIVCLSVLAMPVLSQERLSPRDEFDVMVAGSEVRIQYGRPFAKGRKVYGNLVPDSTIWRTGADEVPVLSTSKRLRIGSLEIPPGMYGLLTIVQKERWILIVSKDFKMRGVSDYNRKKDVGRVEMKPQEVPEFIEQFTIEIENASATGGLLAMGWANVVASVAITPP